MSHVFISYARAERRHAERVDQALNRAGFRTWRDVRDLDTDTDFTGELEAQIKEASHFVVCLTADVANQKRSFVRREIAYALGVEEARQRERPPQCLPIVPLVFSGGELPVHIATWTKVDVPDERAFESAMHTVVERLHGKEPGGPASTDQNLARYLHGLHDGVAELLRIRVHTLIEVNAKAVPNALSTLVDNFPVSPVLDLGLITTQTESESTTLTDALARYSRVLLLGSPGAGKTTCLLAAARAAASERRLDERAPVPILAHLAGWNGERPLGQWLKQRAKLPDTAASIPMLFLLDGLDEVTDPDRKRSAAEQQALLLRAIEADLAGASLVLSCRAQDYRAIGYRAALDGAIQLEPLQGEDVQKYLLARGLASVWDAALKDEQLLELLRSPLLLAIASVAWVDGDLRHAASEAGLFDQFVRTRFRHEAARGGTLPYSEQTTRRLLGYRAVAIELFETSDETFRDDVEKASDEAFLRFAHRMHFLQPGLSGKTQFLHRSLEDFLALPILEELAQRVQDPHNVGWLHFLATRIGKAAVPLLARELEASNGDRRRSAANALCEIEDAATIPVLFRAACSGEKYIRRAGERGLRAFGPAAIPVLQVGLEDVEERVGLRSRTLLVELGDPAVPAFRRLTTHAAEPVRVLALWGIQELQAQDAISEVQARLKDESPRVRAAALKAYAMLADGRNVLSATLGGMHDAASVVRTSASFVAGLDRFMNAIADNERKLLVAELTSLLADQSTQVQGQAATSLAVIATPEAVRALERLADFALDVRQSVSMQLTRTPRLAMSELLGQLLRQDEDALVREHSAYSLAALGHILGEAPRQALAYAAAHDPDHYARGAACDALMKLNKTGP